MTAIWLCCFSNLKSMLLYAPDSNLFHQKLPFYNFSHLKTYNWRSGKQDVFSDKNVMTSCMIRGIYEGITKDLIYMHVNRYKKSIVVNNNSIPLCLKHWLVRSFLLLCYLFLATAAFLFKLLIWCGEISINWILTWPAFSVLW